MLLPIWQRIITILGIRNQILLYEPFYVHCKRIGYTNEIKVGSKEVLKSIRRTLKKIELCKKESVIKFINILE